MLPIRTTPLPGPVEYALDGATESGEIDGCTSSTLRLYGDPVRLEEIVGPPLTVEQCVERAAAVDAGRAIERRDRAGIARQMMAHADEILLCIDMPRRGVLVHEGVRSTSFSITSMCEVLADWALTDTVEGGAMERFKEPSEVRFDKYGRPFRRTQRMLASPSFIRRYIKRSSELDCLRASTAVTIRRAKEIPEQFIRSDATLWADIDTQLAAFRAHHRANQERLDSEYYRRALGEPPISKKYERRNKEKRRKILKRASKMASSVLGAQAVSALARGEKIKVEGPNLALQMERRAGLADVGHSCIAVSMLDHSGALLADLCVYQESIPAIDQAVGFALMVQSGLEKELLDDANITKITQAGIENALVSERHKNSLRSLARDAGLLMPNAFRHRWGHTEHMAWRQAYWMKTKEQWIDIVTTAVLGRDRKLVERLA